MSEPENILLQSASVPLKTIEGFTGLRFSYQETESMLWIPFWEWQTLPSAKIKGKNFRIGFTISRVCESI